MTVGTGAGIRIFIGSVNNDRNTILADYLADSYIEIGEIEDGGEFGDTSESIPFTSLQDGRMRKFKGPRDAGTMPLIVGDDMLDEGQQALEAAEAQPHNYNFKVVLNNAVSLAGTGSEHYFIAQVQSKRRTGIVANQIVKRNFQVAINSAITDVDPT